MTQVDKRKMSDLQEKRISQSGRDKDLKKTCFVITPIGEASSKTRRDAEGVIKAAIDPALLECGYCSSEVSHKQLTSGSITKEIFNSIYNADLVIANLSGESSDRLASQPNPNVMYELAIRHAARKRVIHICPSGQPLPFDIKDYRTIFFENDMFGVIELKKELIEKIKAIELEDENKLSNPIYDSLEKVILKDISDHPVNIGDAINNLTLEVRRIKMLTESRINRNERMHNRDYQDQMISRALDYFFEKNQRKPQINELVEFMYEAPYSPSLETLIEYINRRPEDYSRFLSDNERT